MKKISLFFLALMCSISLFAQTSAKLGIKAGLNVASLHLEEDEDADNLLAPHVGLLAHIHLTDQFALQPELVYSGQGLEDGDFKYKLNYLNLPIMVQYMFDNGFRLETGPQLGLLLSSKIDGPDGDEDLDDDFKKTDVSWGFGVGYLSYSGLGVGARYNLGLTNINEFEPSNKVTNRVLQLGLFYMFDQSHKRKSR